MLLSQKKNFPAIRTELPGRPGRGYFPGAREVNFGQPGRFFPNFSVHVNFWQIFVYSREYNQNFGARIAGKKVGGKFQSWIKKKLFPGWLFPEHNPSLRRGLYSDRQIEQQQNFPPLSRFFSGCSIEVIIFVRIEQQSNRNRKKSKNLRDNPIFYCSIRFGSFWDLGQTCLFEVSDRPNRIEQQTFVSTFYMQPHKHI